jgi:hypothetical protein
VQINELLWRIQVFSWETIQETERKLEKLNFSTVNISVSVAFCVGRKDFYLYQYCGYCNF